MGIPPNGAGGGGGATRGEWSTKKGIGRVGAERAGVTVVNRSVDWCQRAKLYTGIKPTALCSALDKENLIEFPLDFLHYLYNYYMVCALFSHTYHVTHHVTSYDVIL